MLTTGAGRSAVAIMIRVEMMAMMVIESQSRERCDSPCWCFLATSGNMTVTMENVEKNHMRPISARSE